MNFQTIILSWDGPYNLEEIKDLQGNISNGLYLFAGRRRGERRDKLQYCGITSGRFYDRFREHHKLGLIRNPSIWLGTIVFPQRVESKHLLTAEKLLVYFWYPVLNEKLKVSLPKPTCVISHWFFCGGHEPRHKRLSFQKELLDVIWYDGQDWRTGNLRLTEVN